jgi:cytochrome c-type biogenesis protein CcmH
MDSSAHFFHTSRVRASFAHSELLWVTLGVLCVAASTAAAAWGADPPRAADLEAELVCPVCETTLDQSDAPVAQRMKAFIRERIAAGDSEDEIKDALVAEFGEGVLATPSKSGFGLLAWLVPLGAILVGALVAGLLVRSWSRRRSPPPPEEALDPELDRRVDEELARFEG